MVRTVGSSTSGPRGVQLLIDVPPRRVAREAGRRGGGRARPGQRGRTGHHQGEHRREAGGAGAAPSGALGPGVLDEGDGVAHRCGVGRVLEGVGGRRGQRPAELGLVPAEGRSMGGGQLCAQRRQLGPDGGHVGVGGRGDQGRRLVPPVLHGQGGAGGRGGGGEHGASAATVPSTAASTGSGGSAVSSASRGAAPSRPAAARAADSTATRAAAVGAPSSTVSAHRRPRVARADAVTRAASSASPVVTVATACSSRHRAVTKSSKSPGAPLTGPVSPRRPPRAPEPRPTPRHPVYGNRPIGHSRYGTGCTCCDLLVDGGTRPAFRGRGIATLVPWT